MTIIMRKFSLIFCLLTLVAFAASCGVNHSPVASGSDEDDTILTPAAKKVKKDKKDKKDQRHRVTKTTDATMRGALDLGVKGGIITVQPGKEIEVVDGNLKIKFRVPKDALGKGEFIEMAVYAGNVKTGDRLPAGTALTASNLVINFGPDGLNFKKNCTLQVTIGASMVDVPRADLVPTHWHGDGRVDQAGIRGSGVDRKTGNVTLEKRGNISLKIEVPGFSRYSLSRR